jgi:hypothetical protein
MGSSVIFSGTKVKTLKGTIDLNGGNDIISSTTDPTSSAVSANIGSLLLNSSNGKLYRKNDSGSSTNWTEVGASGQAGINYIANSNAATNTTGWNTYADAAGAQPVDGTGGSPNVTWTRSTTTPLRGAADFEFAKDAANRQGQGVSDDFTIDNADIAKPLTVTFDYEVVSGTYATGDLTVYLIADPTGTPVVIQPAGYQIQAATSGTKMRQIATFQTQASGTSYRLCLHVASTSASAYTLAIDNVVVGPQVVQYGAPVTDWVSFTPTGSWTSNVTYTGKYRRVGDTAEVEVGITCSGAVTAAALTVNNPSGLVIDTSKISFSGNDNQQLGVGNAVDTGANTFPVAVNYVSTTSVRVLVYNASVTYAQENAVTQAVPITFGNTDTVNIKYTFPVVGWSSTVQMSNDTDTRVVAAKLFRSTNQTGVNTNNSFVKVAFDSTNIDTHSGFVAGSNRWVVPVPGIYSISANVRLSGANLLSNGYGPAIYVDGSAIADSVTRFAAAGGSEDVNVVTIASLNAGQYIEVFIYGAGNNSVNTYTIDSGSRFTYATIERLSGPSAIAATETVACRYSTNAGNNVTNNTLTYLDFEDKDYDTHGIVSGTASGNVTTTNTGWKATIPISGKYLVKAHSLSASGGGWVAGEEWVLSIRKNNTSIARGGNVSQATHSTFVFAIVVAVVDCIAGDRIEVGLLQNSGATLAMLNSGDYNAVEIVRVGN